MNHRYLTSSFKSSNHPPPQLKIYNPATQNMDTITVPQTMAVPSDYYALLSLSPTATLSQISQAYQSFSIEHRTFRNPEDLTARSRFKAIKKAYDVLRHPEKRFAYDSFLNEESLERRAKGRSIPPRQHEKRSFDDFWDGSEEGDDESEEVSLIMEPGILRAFEERIRKNLEKTKSNLIKQQEFLADLKSFPRLDSGTPRTASIKLRKVKCQTAAWYLEELSIWDKNRKEILSRTEWSKREKVLELHESLHEFEHEVHELRQKAGEKVLRTLKLVSGTEKNMSEKDWNCRFQWEWLLVFQETRSVAVVACRFGPW
jgi:curved DNA-binding protein CbpA